MCVIAAPVVGGVSMGGTALRATFVLPWWIGAITPSGGRGAPMWVTVTSPQGQGDSDIDIDTHSHTHSHFRTQSPVWGSSSSNPQKLSGAASVPSHRLCGGGEDADALHSACNLHPFPLRAWLDGHDSLGCMDHAHTYMCMHVQICALNALFVVLRGRAVLFLSPDSPGNMEDSRANTNTYVCSSQYGNVHSVLSSWC